jgi:hypothetical protein
LNLGQGLSHGLLRLELEAAARNEPDYEDRQSVVLFFFRADDDGADRIAARVFIMRDTGTADELVEDVYITQQRKRGQGPAAKFTRMSCSLSSAELKVRVKVGKGYEKVTHANTTYISWSDMAGQTMATPGMEQPYRCDLEDENEGEMKTRQLPSLNTFSILPSSAKAGNLKSKLLDIKRSPAPHHTRAHARPHTHGHSATHVPASDLDLRSIPEHDVTPLSMRATSSDLRAARNLVKEARAKSLELNKARVAFPIRNKYGKESNAILPQSRVARDSNAKTLNQTASSRH